MLTNINHRLNQLTKGAGLVNAKRLFLALIATAIVATIAGAQYGEYTPKAKKADLTGTWIVDVHPQGEFAPPSFKSLTTFNSDGTLVETESDALIPPFITPGHGVWEKVRNNEFAFKIVFLTFDEQGNSTGTAVVKGTIFTNGGPNQYDSPARVEFFDGDGNFLFGGDATGTGTRIKLDD